MRIVLIGQAAFGESVLNALVGKQKEILAAFCPPDREGKPPDPVKTAAMSHGIPVQQFQRMRDRAAIDAFRALDADLCVMAFVTDIIPMETLDAPTHGTINFHPSLLPRHRGPSSINWPIIAGEKETGLTIFWPDAGIDTGPILLQKKVAIDPDDTLGTLYFDKIFPLGVDAMVEAAELVEKGDPPRIAQDESQATYESWCKAEHVIIDWTKSVSEIYNVLRGGDPSPGSGTHYDGESIKFFKTSKDTSPRGEDTPGQVIAIDDSGIRVAAKGGSIHVGRVQPEGGKKVDAAAWAKAVGLRPGARFGG